MGIRAALRRLSITSFGFVPFRSQTKFAPRDRPTGEQREGNREMTTVYTWRVSFRSFVWIRRRGRNSRMRH